VSFAAITLCVASQRVFIVVNLYFVIDSVRKLFGYALVSFSKKIGVVVLVAPSFGIGMRFVMTRIYSLGAVWHLCPALSNGSNFHFMSPSR
jgi:hypothetical protein